MFGRKMSSSDKFVMAKGRAAGNLPKGKVVGTTKGKPLSPTPKGPFKPRPSNSHRKVGQR